jgi:Cu2+-exporting ATPase
VRSRILDVLTVARVIVFDKTGTLTEGRPAVLETRVMSERDLRVEEILAIAAAIETASEHVLARAFSTFYKRDRYKTSDIKAVPGRGVEANVDEHRYRIGELRFVAEMSDAEVAGCSTQSRHSEVFLGDHSGLLACFEIGDQVRADARSAIDALRASGFRTIIASGDRAAAVRFVAEKLSVEEWHAGLSPAGKLELIRDLRSAGHSVIMVGDGINDAPVLAAADASIALDAGTALARAAADAVSLGKHLSPIVTAVGIATDTRRIIRQNIAWALFYNVTAVPLAIGGLLAPWMAAIGMSLSSFVVVLNALRLHRVRTEFSPVPQPNELMENTATT